MTELKRVAGKWTVLALTIGTISGTGMFFGPAIAASYAGIWSLLSWLILAVIAVYIGLCFGELISMFPKAGGVYEFAKQSYGRFFSFIIGWVAWLVGNITTVVLIVAAIDYLIPPTSVIFVKIIVSVLFLLLLNAVALLGMQESSIAVITFSAITIIVLLIIVGFGFFHFNTSNIVFSSNLNIPVVFIAIFFIAETFFGWESAAYLSEETKDPEKVIPRSILIATILLGILCFLLALVMFGVFGAETLAKLTAPLNEFSNQFFGVLGRDMLTIGIYLTLVGSAAGNIITMPRLLLALARDKLFLKQFTKIHPKYFTPHNAIIFQTIISLGVLAVGFGKYKVLISLLVPLALFTYTFVMISLVVLRFKMPEMKRPFKVPFGKVGPLVVVGFFISLIVAWIMTEPNAPSLLRFGGSLILIGIPLYLLIELYNDPKMITSVNDLLAYTTLLTERVNLPKRIKKEILLLLGDLNEKSVLEFGCGVGTLTVELAKSVGPNGHVYATSFSKKHLGITKKRIEQQNWLSDKRVYGDVNLIHDLQHTTRVHPDIEYVDAAVSVGMIGYVQDIEKVLKEVNSIMPSGGRICFVDYGDYFHILPNVDWLAKNEDVERVFRNCGFSVQVKRKKGLLWNHIFIYGIKSEKDVPFI